jgi:lipoyl(octanoyl) transferase
MDLTPFKGINPCGYPGLKITQLADLNGQTDCDKVALAVSQEFARQFGYLNAEITQQGPNVAVA